MGHRTNKATSAVLAIIAGAAIGFLPGTALADQVVLRDGTVHEGTILSETRRSLIIETKIHGIKTQLTLNMRDVRSIDRTPAGTEQITENTDKPTTLSIPKKETQDSEDAVPLKREGYRLILEVPIEGGFGTDIYPLSIASSLEWAKENEVTDIVFRINSGGGAIWCSNDIVTLMKEYNTDFEMHMLIESAISASIWPSFNCDTITMTPGSDFGGAVVYFMTNTGSAEVDMKMNGIRAAKLESAADAKGHESLLVKAMTLSESSIYAYQEFTDGPWRFSGTTEGIPKDYETIDGPDTVLTLTAKQAEKYGLVDYMPEGKSLEEWAEIQGIEKWDSAGDIGHTIAQRENKKAKTLHNRLDATLNSFSSDLMDYNSNNRISLRGAAMQSMKKHLGTYKRIMKQAEQMSMPSIFEGYENAIDVVYWEQEIETNLARLRRYKRMGP